MGPVRRVVILGSTGSIGTQALDVIRANRERFSVVGLAAGTNADLLAEQATEFGVADTALGAEDAERLVRSVDADVVLNGITGSVGLGPTLAALESGRTLALANKESLIVGGELVTRIAKPGQIVPVDSEHSAIAQALRSGTAAEVARLVLTASGGPFRGRSRDSLRDVTPAEALAHPTWDMGLVVTTNSSTLVNKGLEVIEAHVLFDVPYERIEVTVHPQSVVHSMVEFVDGSTIAQASPPDMRLPISLGLDWPNRVAGRRRSARLVGGPRVDVRTARRRGLPGCRAGQARRHGGQHLSRCVQRGERAGGHGVPRRPHRLPRHPRHGRARRRRPRPRNRCSPARRWPSPNSGRAPRPTASSPPTDPLAARAPSVEHREKHPILEKWHVFSCARGP